MIEGLPASRLDHLDRERYPQGPNGMALFLQDRIAELKEQKAACRNASERKPINKHMFMVEGMLRWVKSRAGYVPTPEGFVSLDDPGHTPEDTRRAFQ